MSDGQYEPECRCHYCTQIRSAGTLAGAAQGMNVDHDPAKSLLKPLPPSEKAELQVSLLNEIGAQLARIEKRLKDIEIGAFSDEGILRDLFKSVTRHLVVIEERMKIQHDITHGRLDRMETMFERIATEIDHVASRYAEQAETLKTYKLSLEGIQGLLVDLDAKFDGFEANVAKCFEFVARDRGVILEVEKRAATAFRQLEQQIMRRFDMQDRDLIALANKVPKPRKAGKRKRVKR